MQSLQCDARAPSKVRKLCVEAFEAYRAVTHTFLFAPMNQSLNLKKKFQTIFLLLALPLLVGCDVAIMRFWPESSVANWVWTLGTIVLLLPLGYLALAGLTALIASTISGSYPFASGDLGLAKTFWIGGVLVNLIMLVANRLIGLILPWPLVLCFAFGVLLYWPIWCLSVWRAANKYNGTIFWPILAKALAVVTIANHAWIWGSVAFQIVL